MSGASEVCHHNKKPLRWQVGPVDGGEKSKRYICPDCGADLWVTSVKEEVSYGPPKRDVLESEPK